jgi:hypothetical protein
METWRSASIAAPMADAHEHVIPVAFPEILFIDFF